MPNQSPTHPTDGPDNIEAFLAAIDTFAQSVRRARGARAGAPVGLTLSQYGLLEPLLEQDPARIRELAAGAGITPPTATRILDTLERRGLVRRTQAPDDRRGVSVKLTEDGRTILDTHHEWLRSQERAFHAALNADERSVASDLMVRLAALIDTIAAGPPV